MNEPIQQVVEKKMSLWKGRRNGHQKLFSKHVYMYVVCYSKLSLVNMNIFAVILFFRLMEDAYVMKDPFSEERGFITLGSSCIICKAKVCLSQVWKIC